MYALRVIPRYLRFRWVFLLAVAGVGIAVAVLLVVLAIMEGYPEVMAGVIRGLEADLLVMGNVPGHWEDWARKLEQAPEVAAVAPRLAGSVVVSIGSGFVEGGEFVGVDPEREARVSNLGRFVDEAAGKPVPPYLWFRAAEPGPGKGGRALPGLLLGWEFAQQFGVKRGQVVTLATTWRDPGSGKEKGRSRRFSVTGFFRTGVYDFDLNFFFLPLEAAQRFREGDGGKRISYSGVALRPGLTAEEGQRRLADHPLCRELSVHTWKEWRGGILRAVANQRNILLVMYSFILVLAAATVVMTLVMMVGEKREEIGIFKSLGSSSWEAGAIFLGCGVGITLLGGGMGTLLGSLFVSQIEGVVRGLSWLMGVDVFARSIYQLDRLPVSLTFSRIFLVVGPALALGALASLIPAWLAARKRPVEVMFRR